MAEARTSTFRSLSSGSYRRAFPAARAFSPTSSAATPFDDARAVARCRRGARSIRVQLGQSKSTDRLFPTWERAARVPGKRIRESASRRRCTVGRHGIAGGSGASAGREAESASRRLVGGSAEAVGRATKEDLLQPYKPTWAAAIDPEGRDAHDNWYGTYLTPEVIGYNRDAVKEADAPKDWDDLIDPKWKGKIVIRDPIASGTMRAIFGAIMVRSIAQTGKPDAGYEWLRKLDANTRDYVLNPTILYQKLGRQEGVVTMWDMPDFATLEQRTRIPIKWVIPRSGTPLLGDGIGIVGGTKLPKEAEEYYEYVTTPEAMIAAADSFLRIPARKDIPVSKLPSWIRDAMTKIKPMPVDREVMAAHLDEWMKYWDANIRNRGQRR